MYTVDARNINEAYATGCQLLASLGRPGTSRNGPVRVLPQPVATRYAKPLERVLYDPRRDANPFLHLFDALWCLAGRDDAAWLAQFAPRMLEYSDNGVRLHGAYGFRWREAQGVDQLDEIISLLHNDPTTRRAVLQMWDASADLGSPSKDLPCNLMVHFQRDEGQLHMTVFNRSNDMLWGAYGANAVQFSILQEYVAALVGVNVGWYEQVSSNAHAYDDTWDKCVGDRYPNSYILCPYAAQEVRPYPLVGDVLTFDQDLLAFMRWAHPAQQPNMFASFTYENPFFAEVADPMLRTHRAWKLKAWSEAYHAAGQIQATDWQRACVEWLDRRTR